MERRRKKNKGNTPGEVRKVLKSFREKQERSTVNIKGEKRIFSETGFPFVLS